MSLGLQRAGPPRPALATVGWLVLAVVLITYIDGIYVAMEPCGYDGGVTPAARASPQGKFCERFTGDATLSLFFLPLPAVLVAVGAMVARRARNLTALWVALALACMVLAAPVLLIAMLSGECPTRSADGCRTGAGP